MAESMPQESASGAVGNSQIIAGNTKGEFPFYFSTENFQHP
jgi:hypothetical protein